MWAAIFTALLAYFSYLLYQVSRTADETQRAIQRAFVYPAPVTVVRIFNPTSHRIDSMQFIFGWRNSGVTPTKHMSSHVSWQQGPLPRTFNYPDIWNNGEPHVATLTFICPKGETSMAPVPVPLSIIQQLQYQTYIYFWGWAKYQDVFPRSANHITKFCYELIGFLGNPFSAGPSESVYPRFNNCTANNCADDECENHP
jgi:hypothetical protein